MAASVAIDCDTVVNVEDLGDIVRVTESGVEDVRGRSRVNFCDE
jgi:hypothetical protein